MRRLTAAAAAAWLVAPVVALAAVAAPAAAQPDPTEPPAELEIPEAVPGEPQCAVTDPRLAQLSGLVALDDGFAVVNDGSGAPGIFILDGNCQTIDLIGYPSPQLDPEDLELDSSTDTLWVADTGDNFETADQQPRVTVALWRIELAGDPTPVIHRFTYEDGQPRDAEALVLGGDGVPIIVTKSVGVAELFRPVELAPGNPPEQAVTLEKLGEFSPPDTGTEHDLLPSSAASRTVTGGATSPDGSRVALRTYTDALEFDVVDGDVAAAIIEGQPRVTPLAGEPWGEAIAYTPDGERFLTLSEVPEGELDFTPEVLSYAPTPPPAPQTAAPEEPAAADSAGGGGLFNSVQDIINVVAAVGVLGLLLVIAGVVGIVRARRRFSGTQDGVGDPPEEAGPVTGRARLGGESRNGWEPEPGREQAGGVYTSAGRSGGEHAGNAYAGGEYAGGGGGGEYAGGEYAGNDHRGNEYRGTEYGGAAGGGGYQRGEYGQAGEYGQPGNDFRGTEYGGQPTGSYQGEYGGAEYGEQYRDGGYGPAGYADGYPPGGQPEAPYDQDWPGAQAGQHQRGGRYADAGNGHPDGGTDSAPPGGTYQSNAPDYYSDDPDYPYEFREQGRW